MVDQASTEVARVAREDVVAEDVVAKEVATIDPADLKNVLHQLRELLPNGFSLSDLRSWHVTSTGQWVDQNGESSNGPLDGVLLRSHEVRAFWGHPIGEGAPAPDCRSMDAVVGSGDYGKNSKENPTGRCNDCPMSVFGSSAAIGLAPFGSQAQACRLHILVYLLRTENTILPEVVWLPPLSVAPWRQALVRAAGEMVPLLGSKIELDLISKDRRGLKYGELIVNRVESGDVARMPVIRELRQLVRPSDSSLAEQMALAEGMEA